MAITAPTPMYNPSYNNVLVITPVDATPIPAPSPGYVEAFSCDVGGVIVYVAGNDQVITFTALAGVIYKVRASSINSTGTTATGIKGYW
jgi:hypothetical protein